MPISTKRRKNVTDDTHVGCTEDLPFAVKKLLCGSGKGGRMQWNVPDGKAWKFSHMLENSIEQVEDEDDEDEDDDDDDDSIGSSVTILEDKSATTNYDVATTVPVVTPGYPSLPASHLDDLALKPMPKALRCKQRKAPDDCHALILWLELQKLVKEHFACTGCSEHVANFHRRTVRIATGLDFFCKSCKMIRTAEAIRSNYIVTQSDKDFICRERRIDNYELNWRLIMATQLLGELQIGGGIIGLFLDLRRGTFQNSWMAMEEALGTEQIKIGQRVANLNLKIATLGKVGTYCEDGKVRYPVSYDMGWQKAARTYDSLSGQGLMIGDRTKCVQVVQDVSVAQEKIEKNKTPECQISVCSGHGHL
jgi:hypothetical protein